MSRPTVRAAVLYPDHAVTVTEVVLDPPGPGEVEVEIAAAGVCRSDLHAIEGHWPVPVPAVLGHEGAGIVTSLGAGVTGLEVGDHVVLSWVPACGSCRHCAARRPWLCEPADELIFAQGVLYDGTSRWHKGEDRLHHFFGVSAFAERVVVPSSGAIPIRRDAPLDVVAIVGCAVATGVGAVLNTAQVPAGAEIAVIGCGGVGLSCVQGARIAGAARIVAVDVNPAKLAIAKALGAHDTVDVSQADTVIALRDLQPAGFDYVIDAIGHVETTEQAIAALGMGGAAVIVGAPRAGETARFDPLALVDAGRRILGSNYGSTDPRRDFPRLVDRYMTGELDLDTLISGSRPLTEIGEALKQLADGHALRTLLIP
ncbi:Zn-dependent alcohol dehydrogenase [Actinomadura sp. DC4]|uniref:Zn-dependent alcohol dehydrogenase n=1 Tax=Actinomadura sp. DC4 TaxID=3055069 RepID=UPI0025B15600|nr:Zn-dependent alcohol dehydrogenase [Actinomadura sp. DC4]MDN3355765.1 Zn-dependent alcohol dehydrogenase [Actinomadura sp. DC4]